MRSILVFFACIVGCSSETSSDGVSTDAASDTNPTADTRVDGATVDAPTDTATDTFVAVDSSDAAEAASDTAPGDASGKIVASTTATVTANCMPIVPADPATIGGTLTVKNGTGAPIGPVTAELGVLRAPGGAPYATWKIDKIDLGTIAAGATGEKAWKKTADTWSSDPADQICKKCSTEAVVELTVQGLGTTSGTPVASATTTVSCVF